MKKLPFVISSVIVGLGLGYISAVFLLFGVYCKFIESCEEAGEAGFIIFVPLVIIMFFLWSWAGWRFWRWYGSKYTEGVDSVTISMRIFYITFGVLFIGFIFYLLSADSLFNTKTTKVLSNNCLDQNVDKDPQELVKDVVIEFEEAQILGDQRALSNCVSPSLDLSFLRTPTNRGLGCYTECFWPPYEIAHIDKSGVDEYAAGVKEHRKFYSYGIGGGSYPEATVPAKFVLKKINNRWLIISYDTKLSYSYGE